MLRDDAARPKAAYDSHIVLNFSLLGKNPIDFFFADDSCQRRPSRPGMQSLVAFGGIRVEAEQLGELNKELDELCRLRYNFPRNEEFKWSPSRSSWMARRLIGSKRQRFFTAVLDKLAEHAVVATVIISTVAKPSERRMEVAANAATKYYLERVEQQCDRRKRQAFVIVDRPGGGPKQEGSFLKRCAGIVESGTYYVKFGHFAHGLLAADSRTSRLLQAADLVVSCTAATVAGEQNHAPPIFERVVPLLDQADNRIQGYGLKIEPDDQHSNLFYWLIGATRFWKGGWGIKLPRKHRPWAEDPMRQ